MATKSKKPSTRPRAAEQAEKDRKVLDMRAAGLTLQQIADEHFSGHRANAQRALQRIVKVHVAEGVDGMRAVENHRLDRLQSAHWASALRGHLGATQAVIKLMERRAKLNGLDVTEQAVGTGTINVVVDPGLFSDGGMAEPELVVEAPEGDAGV